MSPVNLYWSKGGHHVDVLALSAVFFVLGVALFALCVDLADIHLAIRGQYTCNFQFDSFKLNQCTILGTRAAFGWMADGLGDLLKPTKDATIALFKTFCARIAQIMRSRPEVPDRLPNCKTPHMRSGEIVGILHEPDASIMTLVSERSTPSGEVQRSISVGDTDGLTASPSFHRPCDALPCFAVRLKVRADGKVCVQQFHLPVGFPPQLYARDTDHAEVHISSSGQHTSVSENTVCSTDTSAQNAGLGIDSGSLGHESPPVDWITNIKPVFSEAPRSSSLIMARSDNSDQQLNLERATCSASFGFDTGALAFVPSTSRSPVKPPSSRAKELVLPARLRIHLANMRGLSPRLQRTLFDPLVSPRMFTSVFLGLSRRDGEEVQVFALRAQDTGYSKPVLSATVSSTRDAVDVEGNQLEQVPAQEREPPKKHKKTRRGGKKLTTRERRERKRARLAAAAKAALEEEAERAAEAIAMDVAAKVLLDEDNE